jgi:hypothetical protein
MTLARFGRIARSPLFADWDGTFDDAIGDAINQGNKHSPCFRSLLDRGDVSERPCPDNISDRRKGAERPIYLILQIGRVRLDGFRGPGGETQDVGLGLHSFEIGAVAARFGWTKIWMSAWTASYQLRPRTLAPTSCVRRAFHCGCAA